MRKNIMMLMLGGLLMMSTTMLAYPNVDDGNDREPEVWRSPTKRPNAYIDYDDANGVATVNFLSAITNAEIIVYLNGIEVENQIVEAVKGIQVPLYLLVYGGGAFTIQVKNGSTLITTYSTIV